MEHQHTSTQITTKTTESPYDYFEIYKLVLRQGKQMFGEKFHYDDLDRPVIMKLITYFLQDESIADHLNIDLYKGLIINGPVGCGKTSILKIINALMPPKRQFMTRNCARITLDYMEDGHKTIQRYTSGSFELYTQTPKIAYFDDLGLEKDVSHFGNSRNVMAEILLHRYDYYMENHMLTYLTTNLKSSELEEKYGLRIRSRIRQMCQLISFSPESKDKRE